MNDPYNPPMKRGIIFMLKIKEETIIISIVFVLLSIGILMVHSASHIWTTYTYEDGYYYIKRHIVFSIFGLLAMFLLRKIPFLYWKRYAFFLYCMCLALFLFVLIS